MSIETIATIVIGIVIAAFGWFIKAGYDNWVEKVDGKMDRSCHDICSKTMDETNTILLDEIRANRKIAIDLLKDFKEKSELVIKAVEK